jgi:nitroreductase
MDAFEALLTRRSVRRYTSDPVSEEMVTQLLRAAMAAPSARNQRPWHFIVVRDHSLLAKVAAANPNGAMVAHAAVALVVCADLGLVKSEGFWVQDCAAATQNLLIAAHATGLGAVWCGIYPREQRMAGLRAIFDLPGHVVPFAVVAAGYPRELPPPGDRFDETRIHMDSYEEGA